MAADLRELPVRLVILLDSIEYFHFPCEQSGTNRDALFLAWELNEQLIARERDNAQCGTGDGLVAVDDHRESACLLVPHIKEVFHLERIGRLQELFHRVADGRCVHDLDPVIAQ